MHWKTDKLRYFKDICKEYLEVNGKEKKSMPFKTLNVFTASTKISCGRDI